MPPDSNGRVLADRHRRALEESAIAPDVVAERGYFTVERKSDLAPLGFGPSNQLVPTLVVPIHGVMSVEPPWYMHRPDETPIKDGRPRKYLIPHRRRVSLDVHPRVRAGLGNPEFPLIVTEGPKKVDALVSAGARAVVGLTGVWNWRGTNGDGGLTALPDWEWVALKDRRTYVVFDSDVVLKEPVRMAMERLGAFLGRRGADVAYVYLPAGEGGAKVGADDLLAAGHDLAGLVGRAEPRPRVNRANREPRGENARPTGESAVQGGVAPPVNRPDVAGLADILAESARDIHAAGVVGEERNTKILKLVFVSRHQPNPIRCVVKGDPSSGKSSQLNAVAAQTAPEGIKEISGSSARAQVYDDEPVAHKVMILTEARALADEGPFAEFVRQMVSEGRYVYETVDRDEDGKGPLRMRRIEKRGPIGFATTTTLAKLEGQVETRVLSLWSDASEEQTAKVVERICADAAGDATPVDNRRWHVLDRWLAAGARDVVIPYGAALGELIGKGPPRLRRDAGALIALIRAHALLHRASREVDARGRIVATITDYAVVRDLMGDVVAVSHEASVKPAVREVVDAVAATAGEDGVQQKALAAYLNRSKGSISGLVPDALALGFLENLAPPRRPYRLVVGEPMPEDRDVLPPAEAVQDRFTGGVNREKPGTARDSEGRFTDSSVHPDQGTDARDRARIDLAARFDGVYPGSAVAASSMPGAPGWTRQHVDALDAEANGKKPWWHEASF